MPAIDSQGDPPDGGPDTPPRRSGAAALAVTAIIAALTVGVVVLSYRLADGKDGVGKADFSALEARVSVIDRRLAGAQKTAQAAVRQARANSAAVRRIPRPKAQPQLAPCLTQLQREIDDLQAYLAYGTTPRLDRVSGGCLRLLKPRFTR